MNDWTKLNPMQLWANVLSGHKRSQWSILIMADIIVNTPEEIKDLVDRNPSKLFIINTKTSKNYINASNTLIRLNSENDYKTYKDIDIIITSDDPSLWLPAGLSGVKIVRQIELIDKLEEPYNPSLTANSRVRCYEKAKEWFDNNRSNCYK